MSTVGALTSAYNSDPYRLQFDILVIVYYRYFLSIFPSRASLILRRFTYVCLFVHQHQRSAIGYSHMNNRNYHRQPYPGLAMKANPYITQNRMRAEYQSFTECGGEA